VLDKFPLLEAEYVDTGQVKYVAYPFNLGRPEMALATEAAWCAQDQNKFFEYQHALFENQGTIAYDQASLTDLAVETGLDVSAFSQCLSSGEHRADVEEARRAAANRGVNSTPTFFINNQRVTGNQPYDTFQRIIEQELVLAQ
jgi:protein-disulfide isomerase